jgi:hypothetical protein
LLLAKSLSEHNSVPRVIKELFKALAFPGTLQVLRQLSRRNSFSLTSFQDIPLIRYCFRKAVQLRKHEPLEPSFLVLISGMDKKR